MYVELVYDKRNTEGLRNAKGIIEAELTKRIHSIFPEAEIRVKPMQANAVNSDCNKAQKEKINATIQEMFEEADMWMCEGT
ncbi:MULTISPECIES: DinI family protein [Pantoea]|uniref:DinI family protein n=2 Tax=Pantoea TaxID=53335 RepID=A0A0U3JWG6_9GAMM|nr:MULTISPECIES: DinI family protein [Pantoea]ALV91564.1 hypothetical protein LK04_05150 [Pantoea vagans]KHJ65738.1 hypothetical protein QU24_22935 [Pantoea rodasii]